MPLRIGAVQTGFDINIEQLALIISFQDSFKPITTKVVVPFGGLCVSGCEGWSG